VRTHPTPHPTCLVHTVVPHLHSRFYPNLFRSRGVMIEKPFHNPRSRRFEPTVMTSIVCMCCVGNLSSDLDSAVRVSRCQPDFISDNHSTAKV